MGGGNGRAEGTIEKGREGEYSGYQAVRVEMPEVQHIDKQWALEPCKANGIPVDRKVTLLL